MKRLRRLLGEVSGEWYAEERIRRRFMELVAYWTFFKEIHLLENISWAGPTQPRKRLLRFYILFYFIYLFFKI